VNVIAPIRTEPGGPAWRQTTFFPFSLTAAAATGDVIAADIDSATLPTARYGDVPSVDAVATRDGDVVSVFVVHRGLDEPVTVDLDVAGLTGDATAVVLTTPAGADRHATNTADAQPVAPEPLTIERASAGSIRFVLPPLAWARLQLRVESTPTGKPSIIMEKTA
jgi:alpha-N-arabinofuranosidase